MKKLRFLYSMKTGITLLIILAILSVIGTLIPQEMPLHWYEHRYSPRIYSMIETFHLHDMYHSVWFSTLFALLTLNLFLCSIVRLPSIYKKATKPYTLGKKFYAPLELEDVLSKFKKLGFKNIKSDGNLIYSTRGKIGYFGSWLTHVGLAVIVICYFIGRMYGFNVQISGLPNETVEVAGTNISVRIDDFLVDYRDDFSINQYYSYIRLSKDEETVEGIVSVNNPVRFDDYSFYQIATGWAVQMEVTDSDENTTKRPMYERDYYFIDDELIVRTIDIHPDIINNSPLAENPRIVYQLIYNNRVESMNFIAPGESLRWRGNTITFSQPQRYTVLEVANDPTLGWVLFGSLLLTIGLIFSFYVNPVTLAARPLRNGGYTVYFYTFKKNEELQNKIQETIQEGEPENDRKIVV